MLDAPGLAGQVHAPIAVYFTFTVREVLFLPHVHSTRLPSATSCIVAWETLRSAVADVLSSDMASTGIVACPAVPGYRQNTR